MLYFIDKNKTKKWKNRQRNKSTADLTKVANSLCLKQKEMNSRGKIMKLIDSFTFDKEKQQ